MGCILYRRVGDLIVSLLDIAASSSTVVFSSFLSSFLGGTCSTSPDGMRWKRRGGEGKSESGQQPLRW